MPCARRIRRHKSHITETTSLVLVGPIKRETGTNGVVSPPWYLPPPAAAIAAAFGCSEWKNVAFVPVPESVGINHSPPKTRLCDGKWKSIAPRYRWQIINPPISGLKINGLFARGGGATALLREEIQGVSEHFRSAFPVPGFPESFPTSRDTRWKFYTATNSDNLSNSLSLKFVSLTEEALLRRRQAGARWNDFIACARNEIKIK